MQVIVCVCMCFDVAHVCVHDSWKSVCMQVIVKW